MGARIKRNLPDAPPPTKGRRIYPPWEIRHYESLRIHPDFCEIPQKSTERWTKSQMETLSDLWKDGLVSNDIAKIMKKPQKATRNKISYMCSKGKIPQRKLKISDEEKEEIRNEFKGGMEVPDICRKHNVAQSLVKRVTK
jgi:hypothetical protein